MGIDPAELENNQNLISRPQGIVLVTGPTGAGKTSTLYGMLNSLHSVERNITTIEDPIEDELAGINQTAVQEKIGLTFGTMLRALLRQDPDVIMLGEMRDAETTNIALQASITGHLVLSTMHTGNAVATVTRLRNIGVPSYVIASAVNGILAQRLVRAHLSELQEAVHPDRGRCRPAREPDEHGAAPVVRRRGLRDVRRQRLQGADGRIRDPDVFARHPRAGVGGCVGSGDAARGAAEGMNTLLTAALSKVNAGKTTLAELFRVIELDEVDRGSDEECPSCGAVTEPDYLACPSVPAVWRPRVRRVTAKCSSTGKRVPTAALGWISLPASREPRRRLRRSLCRHRPGREPRKRRARLAVQRWPLRASC